MPNGPLADSCVWHYILMPNVVQPRNSIQCSPIVLVAKERNSLSLGSLREEKVIKVLEDNLMTSVTIFGKLESRK